MTNRALPSDPLAVRSDEFGLLRIFALDRDEIVTRHGVANLIGALVDPEKVEVVDTKDVAIMGLAAYLVEGYGMAEDDITDETDALNAIDGHVVLIPTSAFNGEEATLSPSPPLRFIGLYGEAEAKPPAPRLTSRASELLPDLETEEDLPGTAPKTGGLGLAIVTVLFLVAAYYIYISL